MFILYNEGNHHTTKKVVFFIKKGVDNYDNVVYNKLVS